MIFSMKNIPVLFAALSIAALSAPAVSHAKIGEPRSDIEGRLLSKIGGAAYAYDSREERYREAMELPYANLFLTMPRSVFHKFYYKRADSASATNSDTIQQHDLFGWEIHIGYNNDVSAMEFYRRHGRPHHRGRAGSADGIGRRLKKFQMEEDDIRAGVAAVGHRI